MGIVLGAPVRSADRFGGTFSDLSRLRGVPLVFVVDRAFRISAVCGGSPSNDAAVASRWKLEIEPIVRALVERGNGGADEAYTGTLSPEEVVRVFSLRGEFGGYAVFVERRRSRKSIRTTCVQYGLSQREFDVLELVVAGKNSSDIGRQLSISDATVQSHVRNVGIKMGCTKRSAMIAKALIG